MTNGDSHPSDSSGHRPPGEQGSAGGADATGTAAPAPSPQWQPSGDQQQYQAPGQQSPPSNQQAPAQGQSYPPPGQGYPPPGQGYPPPGHGHPQSAQGYPQSGAYPPPGQGYPLPGEVFPPSGPGYQAQGGYQGSPGMGQGPLSQQDERTWAMAAHFSALVGMIVGLSFIGPLVVMLVQGPRSPYVRAHAVEALNFNLSVLIYFIVSIVLSIILIGFVLMFAVGVVWLVFTIIAGVKTSNGEAYRYPLTIRMVK